MPTAVFSTMVPAAQDGLQVLLVKAGYWAQSVAEAAGGPFTTGMYPNMTPFAQDEPQVLTAKLAYWLEQISIGGGGGLGGCTVGAGAPPTDGSVGTLLYKDSVTSFKYVNLGSVASPDWDSI